MKPMLAAPTEKLVRAACEEFDRDNSLVEQSLSELFRQYPTNTDLRHVLLKVVALNALYSTQIHVYARIVPNVLDVAEHIQRNAEEIDSALAIGSPEVVDRIAAVNAPEKKSRWFFSFATKYCSFQRPEFYPIWDSRVDRYICSLKAQPQFAEFFGTGEDRWRYSEFRRLITVFRGTFGLGSFSFKEIDKFLYTYGGNQSANE
jgi:hypothetical protein